MENRKIWMRLGVTLNGTKDELETLLSNGEEGYNTLVKILREKRFVIDGESYIPEKCIEEYNNEYGTDHEAVPCEYNVENPMYCYSDRQYEIIESIKRRVARHNYWFVVGNPTFHDDGSIDVPIRKKFEDDFYTKTYKNLRSCTIAELDKHCLECYEMSNSKKEKEETTKVD